MFDLLYLILIIVLFGISIAMIEVDPARPQWLLTEAGVGYRLGEPRPDTPSG